MRRDPGIRNMGRAGLQAPGLARMMAPLREADPGRAPRRFSAGHGGQDLPENATRRQISTGASIWRAGSWLLAPANRAHGPGFCSLRGPERRAARGGQDADRVPACRVQGVSRSLVLWEPPLDPDSLSAACGRIVVDSWGVYGDRRTRPADGQKTDQNPMPQGWSGRNRNAIRTAWPAPVVLGPICPWRLWEFPVPGVSCRTRQRGSDTRPSGNR